MEECLIWLYIWKLSSSNNYTCMSLDGYVAFSHYSYFYLKMLPIYVQWYFNISFFFGINIIISVSNNIVKERLLSQSYLLYCCNITFQWPKLSAENVANLRNKWMSEYLWCCISQITIEYVNIKNTDCRIAHLLVLPSFKLLAFFLFLCP
jgi:hypothetical protein